MGDMLLTLMQISAAVAPSATTISASDENWKLMGIIVGGAMGTIMALSTLAGLINTIREWFRAGKDRQKELDAPFEMRVKVLEESARTFRSSEYLDKEFIRIDERINHERNNRQMMLDGLDNRIRRNEDSISSEQLARTKLETQVDMVSNNMQKVSQSVDHLRERFDERMDRLQESLSNKLR